MNSKNEITIDIIEKELKIIGNLYDLIRVIDPVTRQILLCEGAPLVEIGTSCFNKIGKVKICKNCISTRALKYKRAFMKIEEVRDKTYVITALPIDIDNKTYIVELIKDVTDSFFYGHSEDGEGCMINNELHIIRQMTIMDPLTDINNRRFIDERLPVEMEKCFSKNEFISIIMVDVDYFKNINDKFGHVTGDYILKEFAQVLKECIRQEKDWIGRYGGEEFLVCIPGADGKVALEIANRIHEHLLKKKFIHSGEDIKVTASLGVFSTNESNITVEELLDQADKKLYEAKKLGRNRIAF